MGSQFSRRWPQLVLWAFFLLALAYLGRIGWAWRSTLIPTPVATATPTPTPAARTFDPARSLEHVRAQMAFGPRVPNTQAATQAREYIRRVLQQNGWTVEFQAFTYRGVPLVNVVARRGRGPVFIVGAHYDSRRFADHDPDPEKRREPVPGANDGASGTAVLLELARVLTWDTDRYAVWLYFFDAEDQGNIDGWPWAVGARHAAAALPPELDVRGVIVVDMVGEAEQQIFWEGNSTPALREALWNTAARLGYDRYFVPQVRYTIIDDHIPFLERGIPAVDIIDFDYPYWHTTADTEDKIAAASLERVGRVVEAWLESR